MHTTPGTAWNEAPQLSINDNPLRIVANCVSLSPTGSELLFEIFWQNYERGSIIVTRICH